MGRPGRRRSEKTRPRPRVPGEGLEPPQRLHRSHRGPGGSQSRPPARLTSPEPGRSAAPCREDRQRDGGRRAGPQGRLRPSEPRGLPSVPGSAAAEGRDAPYGSSRQGRGLRASLPETPPHQPPAWPEAGSSGSQAEGASRPLAQGPRLGQGGSTAPGSALSGAASLSGPARGAGRLVLVFPGPTRDTRLLPPAEARPDCAPWPWPPRSPGHSRLRTLPSSRRPPCSASGQGSRVGEAGPGQTQERSLTPPHLGTPVSAGELSHRDRRA